MFRGLILDSSLAGPIAVEDALTTRIEDVKGVELHLCLAARRSDSETCAGGDGDDDREYAAFTCTRETSGGFCRPRLESRSDEILC